MAMDNFSPSEKYWRNDFYLSTRIYLYTRIYLSREREHRNSNKFIFIKLDKHG